MNLTRAAVSTFSYRNDFVTLISTNKNVSRNRIRTAVILKISIVNRIISRSRIRTAAILKISIMIINMGIIKISIIMMV